MVYAQAFVLVSAAALASSLGCSRQTVTTNAAPAGSTASTTSATSATAPATAIPPQGAFSYAESCGSEGAAVDLTFRDAGRVTFSIAGRMLDVEGEASASPVDPKDPNGAWRLTVTKVRDAQQGVRVNQLLMTFTRAADGTLHAVQPPGNCQRPTGIFYPEGKEPRTQTVTKRTVCANGAPTAVRSGCICPGTSEIENPCSVGGGSPRVEGRACVHTCNEASGGAASAAEPGAKSIKPLIGTIYVPSEKTQGAVGPIGCGEYLAEKAIVLPAGDARTHLESALGQLVTELGLAVTAGVKVAADGFVADFAGGFSFGGVCDVPRKLEAIRRTADRYGKVKFTVNGSEARWRCLGDESGTCR